MNEVKCLSPDISEVPISHRSIVLPRDGSLFSCSPLFCLTCCDLVELSGSASLTAMTAEPSTVEPETQEYLLG